MIINSQKSKLVGDYECWKIGRLFGQYYFQSSNINTIGLLFGLLLEDQSGWWFWTFFIFPYIGNNHPNWLIFFRGIGILPTRYTYIYTYTYIYVYIYIYICSSISGGEDIFMLNMTTLWIQIASEAVFGIWFRVFLYLVGKCLDP